MSDATLPVQAPVIAPPPAPTPGALMRLALPAAASVMLNNGFRVVDQYVAQWIGVEAQAAIGSCTFVLILLYAVWAAVAYGLGPLMARAQGAQDPRLRGEAFGAGMAAAAVIGLLSFGLCAALAPEIAAAMGLSGETAAQSVAYLRALALAGLPLALAPAVDQALFAMGRTGLSMALHALSTALNLGVSALLVHHFGMGIEAAAAASGLSRGLTLVVALVVLWRELRPPTESFRDLGMVQRLIRTGLPVALNTAAYALVYWALLRWAISPLGPAVNAALGIGFSALEGLSWPLFSGLSVGVSSLVGRQLGAGRPDLAARALRVGLWPVTAAGVGAGLAFGLLAEELCAPFTDDPEVLAQAVLYARVLAFSQPFVAWESLAEGVLQGAGDTRTVLRWSSPLNLLRVPLCWALAGPLGLGAEGVWWGINLTTMLKALGKGQAAWRGRWANTIV